MTYIKSFFSFWIDFIVGDDWHIAAGAALMLLLVSAATYVTSAAWALLPIGVMLILALSLRRAASAPPSPALAPAVRSTLSLSTDSAVRTRRDNPQ